MSVWLSVDGRVHYKQGWKIECVVLKPNYRGFDICECGTAKWRHCQLYSSNIKGLWCLKLSFKCMLFLIPLIRMTIQGHKYKTRGYLVVCSSKYDLGQMKYKWSIKVFSWWNIQLLLVYDNSANFAVKHIRLLTKFVKVESPTWQDIVCQL